MGEPASIQLMMRTPSGKVVPFADWIKTVDMTHMRNDIRKMLIEVHNAVDKLLRSPSPAARTALEQTYFTLMVLLFPIDQPIPVKNEVGSDASEKTGTQ